MFSFSRKLSQNSNFAICMRNVNKYDKKERVYRLKNVNLNIQSGRFIMIMGISGAGKSTLFKAILGDLDIDSGDIETVENKIGYVPQGSSLRTGNSVQDLMEFYASKKLKDLSKKDRQQNIDNILKKLNLLDLKNHLVGKLSGGQSRRLNVAVQLLDNPKLILLDEPDSGLDMESNKELYSILSNLVKQRKSTILIISHMTYMAYKYPYVDDLLFMASQGRICFYGPKKDAYNYFGVNDFDDIYKTVENNQNYFVNKFNDRNFISKKNIKEIEISNSVKSIGKSDFEGYSKLEKIKIPNSVKSIGNNVFKGCSNLKEIEIPDSVKSIGDNAFWGCSNLKEIKIPDSVKSIGDGAFCSCMSLKEIEIPNSIKSIGNHAFSNCTKLEKIKIPNSVKSIGFYAFHGCSNLKEIEIPNSVKSIGNHAFWYCSKLEKIKISNSVKSIGRYTFYKCSNLKEIEIPNSVKSIGNHAFDGCSDEFCIYCNKGSYPEKYAKINNIKFINLPKK